MQDNKQIQRNEYGHSEAVLRIHPITGVIDVVDTRSGFGLLHMGSKKELKDCEYPYEYAMDNAKLFAEAFNVKHQSGKGPKELGEALKASIELQEVSKECTRIISENAEALAERVKTLEGENFMLKKRKRQPD